MIQSPSQVDNVSAVCALFRVVIIYLCTHFIPVYKYIVTSIELLVIILCKLKYKALYVYIITRYSPLPIEYLIPPMSPC